jgi:hypothetical protein
MKKANRLPGGGLRFALFVSSGYANIPAIPRRPPSPHRTPLGPPSPVHTLRHTLTASPADFRRLACGATRRPLFSGPWAFRASVMEVSYASDFRFFAVRYAASDVLPHTPNSSAGVRFKTVLFLGGYSAPPTNYLGTRAFRSFPRFQSGEEGEVRLLLG